MKRVIMAVLIGVAGFVMLIPSFGYCDPPRRYAHPGPKYVVVREPAPRYYRAPVNYHQRNVYHVDRRDDDRSGQVAVAALGGIVIGTLLGTVIAQGR